MLWSVRYRLLCWLLHLLVRCGLDELELETVVLRHQLKILARGGTRPRFTTADRAPSTLGTFLRSFTFGHARQLDRVSRELLHRAFAAGAGPGAEPVTLDVDSTICETYGLAKQGGSRFTYTHVRGYHPLVAPDVGVGEPRPSLLGQPV